MKISYEWLREYINIKARPEAIANWLTMAGHEVSFIERKAGNVVFDIEITPNRPDCLSHMGIAREISAITGKLFNPPLVQALKTSRVKTDIKITRHNKAICPFYTLHIIRNARIARSPGWLTGRISAIGLNPVNNIVDITNFVLFETGQPLHAFDLDKIAGSEIIIRNAKAGELLITIDDIERELTPDMLVIADKSGPIAIAGVMGGKNSAITDKTSNILLEGAYFDPVNIRRTSLSLGLASDSSYRFERGADLENIAYSSNRAASLMCYIAKAGIVGFLKSGDNTRSFAPVSLRVPYLNRILGTSLRPAEIRQILLALGCKVKGHSVMEVVAPSYRGDITREADLIEETARIYGYHNISSIPTSIIATGQDDNLKAFMEKRDITKDTLTASGFSEAITHSLISRSLVKGMLWADEDCIAVKNPLSKEQEIMRPALLPGIIKVSAYNISRQVYNIRLFELSNIYFKDAGEYKEEPYLALSLYSKANVSDQKSDARQGFFQLKGVILNLARTLGVKNLEFEKTTTGLLDDEASITVLSGNTMLGSMGRLKDSIAAIFGITGYLFVAEINFRKLALSANPERYYKPLPRFPYAYRDISFAADTAVAYKEIETVIKRAGGRIVERVELLSEYYGRQIQAGKRSLAMRVIFCSKDKTLAEEEIALADTAIRNDIEKTFNAVLR
jgi:phenylalanyl-tRNA synthetase beta chain